MNYQLLQSPFIFFFPPFLAGEAHGNPTNLAQGLVFTEHLLGLPVVLRGDAKVGILTDGRRDGEGRWFFEMMPAGEGESQVRS